MLYVSHTAQHQMTGLLVTVSHPNAKTLGYEAEVCNHLTAMPDKTLPVWSCNIHFTLRKTKTRA